MPMAVNTQINFTNTQVGAILPIFNACQSYLLYRNSIIPQELPEAWNNVKKQSVVMKQNVAPLQADECNKLRRKLISFDVSQHEFRENFRKTAPFRFASTHPYVRIDKVSIDKNINKQCYYTCNTYYYSPINLPLQWKLR